MYEQRERATAVVFYSLAVIAGPTLGPVIGAAVSQSYLGWRWTEYLTVILASTVVLADIIFLPETYAPVILTRKAQKLRVTTRRWELHSQHETNNFTLKAFLETNLLRPIKMILFEPMVLCITLYNSFTFGILYLLFGAVPIIYEEQRGWNILQGSLPFLAVLLGTLFAAAINAIYSQFVFAPNVDKHGGKVPPEKRLPPMMLGSITFPLGFFLLGWTSHPKTFWFPSVVGLFFIGMSFMLIFQAGINYLIDAYTKYVVDHLQLISHFGVYSPHILSLEFQLVQWVRSKMLSCNCRCAVIDNVFRHQASNTFMRSIFAAALALVAQPLFNNLGIDWACTMLGCISAVFAVVPFLFYIHGSKFRKMSRMVNELTS